METIENNSIPQVRIRSLRTGYPDMTMAEASSFMGDLALLMIDLDFTSLEWYLAGRHYPTISAGSFAFYTALPMAMKNKPTLTFVPLLSRPCVGGWLERLKQEARAAGKMF